MEKIDTILTHTTRIEEITMTTRHRLIVAGLCAVALLGMIARADAQFREPFRPEVRGVVKSVGKDTITVAFSAGRDTPPTEKTYTLAKDVEVCVGGGFRFGGFFRAARLADLTEGTSVALSLSGDQKVVDSIVAEEPVVRGILKGVSDKKGTLAVTTFAGREEPGEPKMYHLAPDAEIAIDDGRGRRSSIKEGKLDDLTEGAFVTLRLSLDKKQVTAVFAEGAMINGVLKALDAAKRLAIVVVRPPRGDDPGEERTLAIAKEAIVLLDDGRGRRLSLKEGKLADVPVGSVITAKLAVDQSFVMMLKAEGPAFFGALKSVDADKRTITIAIPKSREEVEEKTLPLAKDARVTLDGKATKLADLKPMDNGPFVQLRLTLDQKTVQSVTANQPRSRE